MVKTGPLTKFNLFHFFSQCHKSIGMLCMIHKSKFTKNSNLDCWYITLLWRPPIINDVSTFVRFDWIFISQLHMKKILLRVPKNNVETDKR